MNKADTSQIKPGFLQMFEQLLSCKAVDFKLFLLFCFLRLQHPLVYYTEDRTGKWAGPSCRASAEAAHVLQAHSGCFVKGQWQGHSAALHAAWTRGWQSLSNNCGHSTNQSGFKLKNKIPVITDNMTQPLTAPSRIV